MLTTRSKNESLHGRLRGFALALAALVLGGACYDQVTSPDVETDGRVTVTNDPDSLSTRIDYVEEDVPIDPPGPAVFGAAALAPAFAPSAVELTLIAEVNPPTVGGEVVQATSVSRR